MVLCKYLFNVTILLPITVSLAVIPGKHHTLESVGSPSLRLAVEFCSTASWIGITIRLLSVLIPFVTQDDCATIPNYLQDLLILLKACPWLVNKFKSISISNPNSMDGIEPCFATKRYIPNRICNPFPNSGQQAIKWNGYIKAYF